MKVWEGYEWQGKTISFTSFREFVETPAPEGLGTTVDDLVRFCQKYPEIADKIDETIQEQIPSYHPPKGGNNDTPLKKSKGNSLSRNLRILRNFSKENARAAELREQVLKGEISANKALIELGKRRKKHTLEASSNGVIQFVTKYLSEDQAKEVAAALQKTNS